MNNNNTGTDNSGYRNSGDCNSGDCNSGNFNTNEPKMRIFNKDLDITVSEFRGKYNTYMNIPLNRWIKEKDMSAEQKEEIEGWEEMGGYLKTLEYKEACRIWWKENMEDHQRFLDLPNFDNEIFLEITGIDTDESDDVEITVEGKTKIISRKSAKALNLID